MNSIWQLWEKGVDQEVLKKIEEITNELQVKDSQVGHYKPKEGETNPKIRRSKTAFLNNSNKSHSQIFSMFTNFFYEANANAFGVRIDRLTDIQYTEYHAEEDGFYDFHQDCFIESERLIDRKLSLTMQLSDPEDYEGGDFVFHNSFVPSPPDTRVLKKQGAILVFPSFVLHKVEPVTKGIRKSLVAWIDGPCWK